MNRADLARRIDSTLLKPEATEGQIVRLCEEARRYGFATVCVNPEWVRLSASLLGRSGVGVCAVAGFPLGANRTAIKAAEAEQVLRDGGTEVDMVINVGRLIGGDCDLVEHDIATVRRAIGDRGLLKVIIETALLTDEQKRSAARLAVAAGAEFVKTSTGFNAAGGATVDDVRLLRLAVGNHARIKAAGGIRTTATALAMLEAGADRLGASAGAAIVDALPE